MTQHQHIVEACAWGHALGISNLVAPTYVGEWAAVTNICVNPDGSTTAGLSCNTEGCQCTSADFDTWNEQLVAQTRRFVEAQMDTFEAKSSGWFAWSAKGPGGWGFLNGIEKGTIPNPVTARKFPNNVGRRDGRLGEIWGGRGRCGSVSSVWRNGWDLVFDSYIYFRLTFRFWEMKVELMTSAML